MAFNPAYADGTPIHEGDWVRADRGTVNGRVSEVVTSPERALARQLHGCGIVVDAQPHGLVFLSEASLAEDPLQFVRRGPSEQFRMTLSLSLGFGAILLLPALYSLASGLYSAFTDGNVLVISIGRYETSRELVPWQAGWARFAGPIVLMASLLAADGSRGVTLRWWLAGIGASCAMILLAFSRWFTIYRWINGVRRVLRVCRDHGFDRQVAGKGRCLLVHGGMRNSSSVAGGTCHLTEADRFGHAASAPTARKASVCSPHVPWTMSILGNSFLEKDESPRMITQIKSVERRCKLGGRVSN